MKQSEDVDDYIFVSAPNKAGENFLQMLRCRGFAYAALTNNENEAKRLLESGVKHLVMVDTSEHKTWILPEFPVGSIFLFETSVTLCCRYIQICRKWTTKPIYVITHSCNPRLIYKGLGADYVIYTHSEDLSFLIG
ncbi:hypothetical protein [Paenibacillus eucommiae]|uniref:Response regulatory domain-containing protein n=1 Tax=Paenibacillus eucommiae TaxID=1355755 RepID=A0ABS4IQV4_9BACL|nr:hypothetical protein [Paenibacillus eucommiae]MBP1989958.1 hypothetical protein [Paenibacillus eucommiae]